MRRTILGIWGLTILAVPSIAQGHAFTPGHLELRETAPGSWQATLRQPNVGIRSQLQPLWAPNCAARRIWNSDEARTWTLTCEGHLETIGLTGFVSGVEEVLVRLQPIQPRSAPGHEVYRITESHSTVRRSNPDQGPRAIEAGVWSPYFWLGVEHIVLGYDHLAFILLLTLMVSSLRRVIILLSLFTIAHSLTLTLSVLEWMVLAPAPTEAVIALSIAFSAREVAVMGTTGAQPRRATIAFGFGLLHGLGLAGALTDIGLPPSQTPLALLSFNLGVEGGQLLCVLIMTIAAAAFRPWLAPRRDALKRLTAYCVGGLAAYWTSIRIMEMINGA
ncbi:MAG: HupE/UreJ family protein [Myxococcota bacterium]